MTFLRYIEGKKQDSDFFFLGEGFSGDRKPQFHLHQLRNITTENTMM
ncbi:MAG: hypothetical protein SWJ54_25480 [Cyanobacteriota bacterium]|nr:hypothetical protein [Cyanobacteriota bacterium]